MADRTGQHRDDEEEDERGTRVIQKGDAESRRQGERHAGGKTEVMGTGTGSSEARSADETVVLRPEKEPSILAWLIEKEGRRPGATYRLNDDVTSIGRLGDNDIALDDQAVSREHAKIRMEEEKFMLYDLVSENGTLVNGERVANREIVENDEIAIGETVLVLKKL